VIFSIIWNRVLTLSSGKMGKVVPVMGQPVEKSLVAATWGHPSRKYLLFETP
jgi:hypothetical protein